MTNNEYSTLKKVIVGREYSIQEEPKVKEFREFYGTDNSFDLTKYIQNCENKLKQRQDSLEMLSNTLSNMGVEVIRPDNDPYSKINNTTFGSNVRDLFFVIQDYIIITNSPLSNRHLEYQNYSQFFNDNIHKYKIIQIPLLENGTLKRDYETYKKLDVSQFEDKWEEYYPIFEAANIIKHNGYLIMNISNHNEYAGYKYLERILPYKIYPVFIDEHHIDGALNILNSNTALLCFDSNNIKKEDIINHLQFLEDFDFIIVDKNPKGHKEPKNRVIASLGGMFINVLSIDENTVIVNEDAIFIIYELKQRGFTVIPLPNKDSRLFGGGFHCVTLDIERE